jgi:hypothetical protein
MSLLDVVLTDTGFADRGILPLVLRRIRLRTTVATARASIDALADLLEQQREPLSCDRSAVGEQGIGLPCGDQEGGVEGGAVGSAQRDALREDELLEGVKLVAQLLDRIDVGIRHGLFSGGDAHEAIEAAGAAHRLCGGAK